MESTLVVITQPDEPVPSLDEVKAHLRQDFTDDDDDIESKIWGAIAEIEDPQLGWLGRSILQRQLELRLEAFCDRIDLPNGPLQQVDELVIEYDDEAGVQQTLSTAVYRVCDPESQSCRILLRKGQRWPAVAGDPGCIRIRYWAGYAADDVRINNFKSAVKLHVELTYDGPSDDERSRISEAINRLLQPYRVFR